MDRLEPKSRRKGARSAPQCGRASCRSADGCSPSPISSGLRGGDSKSSVGWRTDKKCGRVKLSHQTTYSDERTIDPFIPERPPTTFLVAKEEEARTSRLSRRTVLATAGSLITLSCVVGVRRALAVNPGQLPAPASRELQFLTASESSFLDAAIDRLIPSDALGPGAVEAGVTIFIDHQLAGPYGSAVDWYMQGPWADGTAQQGYQRRRTPAQVYRAAMAAVDDHTRRSSNKPFAALGGAERDGLLHALEDGTLDLGDISATTFFTLL